LVERFPDKFTTDFENNKNLWTLSPTLRVHTLNFNPKPKQLLLLTSISSPTPTPIPPLSLPQPPTPHHTKSMFSQINIKYGIILIEILDARLHFVGAIIW
jgi:hypothetical protein